MKDNKQEVVATPRVCPDFKRLLGMVIFLLLIGGGALYGQCHPLNNKMFLSGEKIFMDVYFRWGILMPKAGTAVMSMSEVPFHGKESVRQRLTFKTTSAFDRIFKMRDTIDCHFTPNLVPLQYEKRSDEGGYYLVDRMSFQYKNNKTYVPTIRYDLNRTKIDTTHVYEGCLFDLLSVTMYLRGLDMGSMSIGDEFPTAIVMGREIVRVKYRYAGQSIVERSEKLKYRTLRFYMDVYDDAFTQSKEALEIWISDDENRIPIKIRAKLKIGAAEAYFSSVTGNRYPLTSEVRIPSSR